MTDDKLKMAIGQLRTGENALINALYELNHGNVDDAKNYIAGVIAGNQMALEEAAS